MLQCRSRNSSGAIISPMLEQLAGCVAQALSKPLGPRVASVDHRLEIAFQMRPAPLQSLHLPVHFCPITRDDAAKPLAKQIIQCRGLASETHREHCEHSSYECPQPRLAVFFLGRRFVDAQLFLRRQLSRQLFIRRTQGCRHLILHFHGECCATRLPQQRAEELGCPPLALTIEGHQQSGERHQPRARLALGHADGQFRTCRFAAAGTRESMPLVLDHKWRDLGQFPYLMPQRLRVAARELLFATPTFGRQQQHDVFALIDRNQWSVVFLVAGLAAAFPLRFTFLRLRPSVRMLRTGRQRRVLRRLLFAFKLCDPIEQHLQEGTHCRSYFGFKFRRNCQRMWLGRRHSVCRLKNLRSCPDQFTEIMIPGCERLPSPECHRGCSRYLRGLALPM